MGIKLNSPILERLRSEQNTTRNVCEWPGCTEDGAHRAPSSRQEPDKLRWFCKTHAAEYNKAWNFFENMTDEEVEAIVRFDTVWNRPSWPIGTGPALNAFMRGDFTDPFDIFKNTQPEYDTGSTDIPVKNYKPTLRQAMDVFGLQSLDLVSEVKQRYKELVKRHHPDAHGAGEESDDRIKEINHAYTVILEFFATKDLTTPP